MIFFFFFFCSEWSHERKHYYTVIVNSANWSGTTGDLGSFNNIIYVKIGVFKCYSCKSLGLKGLFFL